MKQFTLILLMLWAVICLRAEDPAYTDTDAEAYITSAFVTDPTEITRIHQWYRGLKGLNLYTNVFLMSSYRTQHGAVSGSSVRSMVGGVGTINGSLTQTTNGYTFDGNTANFITYANPLQSTALAALSYMVAFNVTPSSFGAAACLIGGNSGGTSKGPLLSVNGSPYVGNIAVNAYQYLSADGSTDNGLIGSASGLACSRAITGGPEVIFSTFTNTTYSITPGFNHPAFTVSGSFGTMCNNGATWWVGRFGTATAPLIGNIAAIVAWNKPLTLQEVQAVRRLYTKTIGAGYIPTINVLYEGDSLTIGANSEAVFQMHLWTNATWQNITQSRNLGVSGTFSSQHLTDYPTQAQTVRVDFDYSPRIYYFLWSGANDLASANDSGVVFSNIKAMWALARSHGYKVVAMTVLDTISISGTASIEKQRQMLNALIRNNNTLYDYLIDVDTIPQFSNNLDATYFQVDHVHLTTAGHQLLAAKIASIIPNP